MKKIIYPILLSIVSFWPVFKVWAQEATSTSLVPCGRGDDMCTFADFFTLINGLMKFLLLQIAIPATALVIIYGGMMMVIYASNSSGRERGKKAVTTAVLGLLIVLGAFVIVKFILITLTGNSELIPSA